MKNDGHSYHIWSMLSNGKTTIYISEGYSKLVAKFEVIYIYSLTILRDKRSDEEILICSSANFEKTIFCSKKEKS